MIENTKRYRAHISHGVDVGLLITLSYAAVCVLMLIPYARYASWVIPLFLLLWEKESDFVLFMEAQLLPVAAAHAFLSAILDWPLKLLVNFLNRSISLGLTLLGDFTGYISAILSAVITVVPIVVLILVAARAKHYIQARIIWAGAAAEKILSAERFR